MGGAVKATRGSQPASPCGGRILSPRNTFANKSMATRVVCELPVFTASVNPPRPPGSTTSPPSQGKCRERKGKLDQSASRGVLGMMECDLNRTSAQLGSSSKRSPAPPSPSTGEPFAIYGDHPLAIDLYVWLTYRTGYLKGTTLIPWSGFQAQLGAEYGWLRDFRRKDLFHFEAVLRVYPTVTISQVGSGLRLCPPRLPPSQPPLTYEWTTDQIA